jgi:hypothetical protein
MVIFVVGVLVSGCLGREPTPSHGGDTQECEPIRVFSYFLGHLILSVLVLASDVSVRGRIFASVVHLHGRLSPTPASTYRFFASRFQSASYYTSPRLTMYLPTFFASLPPMLVRMAIFEVIVSHRLGTHPCLCSVRTNTSLGRYIATPRVSAVCYVKELGRLGVAPYLPRWAVGRWRGCSLSTLQMDWRRF